MLLRKLAKDVARSCTVRSRSSRHNGVYGARFMSVGGRGGAEDSGGDKYSVWNIGTWFGEKSPIDDIPPVPSYDAPLGTNHAIPVASEAKHVALESREIEEAFPETGSSQPFADAASRVNDTIGSANSESVLASGENVAVAIDAVATLDRMNPSHVMMQVLDKIHMTWDIPYYQGILVMSLCIRLFLFPLAVTGMVNASRMQYIKPEITKMNERMLADENKVENKPMYDAEIKALFLKYNVNPAKQLVVPLVQIPIFMSMFFGMRNMGEYFPGFAQGGTQWFVDLTAADATMALPILNACIFLTMIEMGGEGGEMTKNPNNKMLLNFMRGMAVCMVPLTMSMPAGLFVYWLGNGTLSLTQMMLFKNADFKARFGIMPPPPPEVTEESSTINADGESVSINTNVAAATTADLKNLKDKSPFLKLYEENLRLVEANKRLMEKAAKDGKYQ